MYVDAMAPQPARLIDTGAVQQAVEPGVEAVGAAQGGQVTPGPDERLLDGVLGLVWIAQDEPGGGIQPEDRGACQRGEGVMIASSRSLHELLLHHAPRQWHRRHGVLIEYGEARYPVRSESAVGPVGAGLPSTSPTSRHPDVIRASGARSPRED